MNDIENITPGEKGLRDLANKQSFLGLPLGKCKTKVATKKLSCKAAGKLGNSKCYSSLCY